MSIFIFAFFLGILFYYLLYQHLLLIIFVLLLGFLSYRFNFFKLWIAFLCGILWIFSYVIWQGAWVLPEKLEGVPVVVTGTIESIPEVELANTHFLFSISQFDNPKIKFIRDGVVRCTWQHAPHLTVGETWQFSLKLKKLHSPINPGGFDYEAWAFAHGIRATGSVDLSRAKLKISAPICSYAIDRLRQNLGRKIDESLSQSQTKGLIKALVIGDQSSILADQWHVLRQTGTNHLFAIAGLHIGFVSHLVYQLLHWSSRRLSWVTLRMSAPLFSAFGSLGAAVIYSGLAGFSLPTKRAVLMLMVFLIAKIRQRNIGFWQGWFIALGAILLMNPLQILTESFWLSFTAVGSLIYGFQNRISLHTNPILAKFTHSLKTQWITSVALIPLTLCLFQQAPLLGFFANFVAIPWIGFLVAPLSLLSGLLLLACPFVGNSLLHFSDFLLSHFWPILREIGAIPIGQWYQVILTPWVLLTAAIGILLLLAPKGFPARWLVLIWIMPLIFYMHKNPKLGEADFTLLDVGQGLSAVVRTQNHVLIFDTGARYKNGFDAGESILLPFLRVFHITHIDTLMVSHGDNDHIGGSNTLLQTLPVDRVITSVPNRFKGHQVFSCLAGQVWWWDGVKFEVLYPYFGNSLTGNNSSCVLKVTASQHAVLLTGDIEKNAEKQLLETNSQKLAADLLVAPHHGSKTSSTEDFIRAVHPCMVLFPVGYRNQYHLPAPMIVTRYQEAGIATYDSVRCGAINVEFTTSSALPVHCYREENKRFWRDP